MGNYVHAVKPYQALVFVVRKQHTVLNAKMTKQWST